MNILKLNKLSFTYPNSQTNLFDDFNLIFQEPWTVIAGSNGCGKSTLLKLIAGMLEPDRGSISFDGDILYCQQETSEIPENLYTSFWSPDNDVRKFFSILKVTEEMLERYATLSGGEKKRIQIACALAENPGLLLLDEPTNHLDKMTVQLILQALKSFNGMGIMVSHDRFFADSLCSKTVYLFNESKAFAGGRDCIVFETYSAGLTKALEIRTEKASSNRQQWDSLNSKANAEKQKSQKLAEEIAKSKNRLSKKSIDPKDHDAKLKMDVYRLSGKDRGPGDEKARLDSQIERTQAARDSVKKSLQRKEGFSVATADYFKPINIEETELTAGNYKLHIPHIELTASSKIALTGQNGAGKTLFINHIISQVEKTGRQNQIMYLPQEISDEQQAEILEHFNQLEEDKKGEVLSTVYRLGSEPENLNSTSQSVSPGELRKLMIAMSITQPLSLLILDEPTNHMDITSVLALENALAEVNCGLLIVSHDEAFLEKITNQKLTAKRTGENEGEIKITV